MSKETIIKVEGLSKQYLLNKSAAPKSDTLYGNIWNGIKNLKNIASKKETEEFWALNDVSFEIQQGDRVGIIGRNGAGKSTLLKVLSRITPPTKGRIEITGRVASLLEVGTGFHGDLSGRENIYLNGSILGMSKQEIDRKFDEIVAFAEVEKFLDTPVKRYSSGMYVRLAFAVAAHLEPEILIVDEVLAVGDIAFQKKCMGKMKDVSTNEGRTILFVSHNMAAIQNICDKCIYMKNGTLVDFNTTELVIPKYLMSSQATSTIMLADRSDRMGNGAIRFQSIQYKDVNGLVINNAQCGSPLNIELSVLANSKFDLSYLLISIGIDDENGQRITHLSNNITNQIFDSFQSGMFTVKIHIPLLPLKSGSYTLTLFSSVNSEVADWIQEATVLQVESGDFFKTGKLPEESQGSFYINHSFSI
ncbi:MAG: ABC transporter ATP-binding protein [Bacteroidia bacterium]